MATLPYAVVQRKHKNKDGSKDILSKHYYVRFRVNGQLKYVRLNATKKKEAEKEAVLAYAKEAERIPPAYSRNSLKTYLTKNKWFSPTENPLFLESKSNLPDARMGYHATKRLTFSLRYVFEELNDELGKLPYQNVTKKDVKAFMTRLVAQKDKKGNPIPISRVNRILSALSDVYKYIISNDDESIANPFDKSVTKRLKQSAPKEKFVFEPEEIKRMLNPDLLRRCKDVEITIGESTKKPFHYNREWWLGFLDSPHYKLLSFMALTGLRRNEACALTKAVFDKNNGRVVKIKNAFKSIPSIERMKNWLDGNQEYKVIGLPKTERERTIILCDKAYYTIEPLLEACEKDSDFIFVTKRGEGKYRNLYHLYYGQYRPFYRAFFEIFCRNFNISIPDDKDVSPHCLRTSLNTNLLKNAKDIKESWVAFYMGWLAETLTRTQQTHYTHYGPNEMWQVANSINLIYTGQEMLWRDYLTDKRGNAVEIAEAELLNESEHRLAELQVKGLLFELATKLANYDQKNTEERFAQGKIDINRIESFLGKSAALSKDFEKNRETSPLSGENTIEDEQMKELLNHFKKLIEHLQAD